MRIFYRLAFDGYINGTTNVYSDPTLVTQLGSVDQLAIGGYTSQISGTSTTLTVQVEHSFDNLRWQNRNGTPEVTTAALSTTAEAIFAGNDGDATIRPTAAFARLRIALAGSGNAPAGQVRLWVTGRDQGEG